MIWLFPGADIPITAANIISCLSCAKHSAEVVHTPEVFYFSSVPYVLQMLSAEFEGLEYLKRMELVGVGGAALTQRLGDKLVEFGINLVSRFGSAECGFLLSSHRKYATDKEWQYLRAHKSPHLKFERKEGELAELVVLREWPHRAKTNREDGAYATADLFAPHPTILHAWKYHSRADSQITLITGKKFDPEPLEAAIATSSLVSDVLIFGNGLHYPGALLFRSSESKCMTEEEIIDGMWPFIERLNTNGQSHTKLSKSMLAVIPNDASSLEKSSKGTIIRPLAEKSFFNIIQQISEGSSEKGLLNEHEEIYVPDEDVAVTILDIIKDVLNTQEPIPEGEDLFSYGVDSVACVQIRALAQQRLLSHRSSSLPLNVVYDCGTIKNLSKYIISTRKGKTAEKQDEIKLMQSLVEDYRPSNGFLDQSKPPAATPYCSLVSEPKEQTIILTGATGALGAHVLSLLRSSPKVSRIHCLVRAATKTAAEQRVSKALVARKKVALDPTSSKVVCHPCRLSEPFLGLDEAHYNALAQEATVIIHSAWAVNFSMRLSNFVKDHINGVKNLIDIALANPSDIPTRFLLCSSIATVLGPHTTSPVLETISNDPLSASTLGYSRSKWVAEAICEKAYLKTRMRDRIGVLRIGQLCGDSENGVWNASEAWPLMISTMKATKSLPDLGAEPLSWLPVDIAAEIVVEIALPRLDKSPGPIDQDLTDYDIIDPIDETIPVFHILNPCKTVTWQHLLCWLRKLWPYFDVVSPSQWLAKLESLEGGEANHPAKNLIGLWREAYCNGNGKAQDKEDVIIKFTKTLTAATSYKKVNPIDEQHFEKMWRWMEREMMQEDSHATGID